MYIALIILSLCILAHGCQTLNDKTGMKDDNIIEESIEAVIKAETGIDMDLSPRSPE